MSLRGKLIWEFPQFSRILCTSVNKAVDFAGGDGLHGCLPEWRIDLMSETSTSTPISGTPLDELTQRSTSEEFLAKHQVKLIALASLLIVLALGLLVQREIKKSKEEAAGALLVSSKEASDLEDITADFAETTAAGSAKLLLADKQWQDGKQDDAVATLRGLIDSAEAHPARANAQASLAAKLLQQGKTADAEALYKELTEDSSAGYLAAYAWITLGDMAVKKGDLEAAEKAYTTVEKDFSKSSYSQEAITRRLLMKAQKPVEIAAPIEPLNPKIINSEGGGNKLEINNMLDALKAGGVVPPEGAPPAGNK
jgi:predicted negative regulator of RcsB-dependent stress response